MVMNEEIITDLKQFISASISQQTAEIRGDISELRGDVGEIRGDISELRGDIKRLDNKIDDLSASVAEAIEVGHEATDRQLKNHDSRICRLEQKAA